MLLKYSFPGGTVRAETMAADTAEIVAHPGMCSGGAVVVYFGRSAVVMLYGTLPERSRRGTPPPPRSGLSAQMVPATAAGACRSGMFILTR
eukprot:gene11760-biopygen4139